MQKLDYVARFPGMPGYGAWCADDPECIEYTEATVADWIRRGATVESVTTDVARAGIAEYLDYLKRRDGATVRLGKSRSE